jgi:hypothetical protein
LMAACHRLPAMTLRTDMNSDPKGSIIQEYSN